MTSWCLNTLNTGVLASFAAIDGTPSSARMSPFITGSLWRFSLYSGNGFSSLPACAVDTLAKDCSRPLLLGEVLVGEVLGEVLSADVVLIERSPENRVRYG